MDKLRKNYLLILVFLIASLGVIACVSEKEPAGKALATQYCQSCHLLPEPSTLTKTIWEANVLPLMAARMG